MKKFLFIMLFATATICANAQTHNYKTIAQCGNDTLKFLKYNFEEQKNYFIGKPVSVVLTIYRKELSIQNVSSITTNRIMDPNNKEYMQGVYINFFLTLSHNFSSIYILLFVRLL